MRPVFHYLDIPARGEATRVALAVAGVDFEDRRMSFAGLGASEFKAVPVYEVRTEANCAACPRDVSRSQQVQTTET